MSNPAQKKLQINAFMDISAGVNPVSSIASNYVQIYSDKQKTNVIGCVLQNITPSNFLNGSSFDVMELYKLYNVAGSSTEFSVSQVVKGNLFKALNSNNVPMKAAVLSGSGPANGFNKVTIYKKQDAASGLVSLAITWEMDSMKVQAEQDFYMNLLDVKKSIDGKSNIVSFYTDKALTQVAGNIVSNITTSQLPSIKETYQSLNSVMNFSANTNIPKGALVLNSLQSGSISSLLPLEAKSTLTSGILSGALSTFTQVKIMSNVLSSNVFSFKVQVNIASNLLPALLPAPITYYAKSNIIPSLSDSNIGKLELFSNKDLSGSPQGLMVLTNKSANTPGGASGSNVNIKLVQNNANSNTPNVAQFAFVYNQNNESLQDALKFQSLSTRSLSGHNVQNFNGIKLDIAQQIGNPNLLKISLISSKN